MIDGSCHCGALRWELDQQMLRQQINPPPVRGGIGACPAGAIGC